MSDQKHIHAVEKRLKEATSRDRARIQLGHISQFGLLELSRQRLHPSLIETNSAPCQHCRGTGLVRSVESMSLLVLRAIENEGITGRSLEIVVTVPTGVDLYLLNQKRASLTAVEARYQMHIIIARDDLIISPDFRIESLAERKVPLDFPQLLPLPSPESIDEDEHHELQNELSPGQDKEEIFAPHHASQGEGGGRRRRRRRPFSKRRDHDRPRDPNQGEQHGSDYAGPKFVQTDNARSSASIEEQIVSEILGVPQQDRKSSVTSSSKEDNREGVVREEGASEHPRRRRRRRRSGQRHQQQQGSEGESTSTASPVVEEQPKEKAPTTPEKPSRPSLKSVETSKPKSKDVTIPITSLPEGPESPSKKSPHGRWWKRLLES
jgi:ribonuclease E